MSWPRSAWQRPTSCTCSVPGALEIPAALQALAERGGFSALIALGCIIRGETYHFELVANESARRGQPRRAGLPVADRQCHPDHREPGAGDCAPGRQGSRRGTRCGRDGAPAARLLHERRSVAEARRPAAAGAQRADRQRGAQGFGQIGPHPRARVRPAGALPAPGGTERNSGAIDAFTRDLAGFQKADAVHYDALLHGAIAEAGELDALIVPLLDRKLTELSPIEHATLWIGVYEFQPLRRRALARRPQRMHRAGQGVRRYRRSQVRQCRAQWPGAAIARRRSRARPQQWQGPMKSAAPPARPPCVPTSGASAATP